jgi:hypothetical protein
VEIAQNIISHFHTVLNSLLSLALKNPRVLRGALCENFFGIARRLPGVMVALFAIRPALLAGERSAGLNPSG